MSYQDLPASELEAFLQTEGLTIIDQRDAATRARGELANAQPVSDALVHQLRRRRREDPAVLVYCYHGNQSRGLCELLVQFGLRRVYNLAGGWDAWQAWQRQQGEQIAERHRWLRTNGFDPENVNGRSEEGFSALMFAALHGDRQLVGDLLARGADPNHINDDGHHALWFACVHGDLSLIGHLIQSGADLDNRNVNGVTCAIYAASTGKIEVLKQLVEAGADLNICTDDGYNALDSATTLPVLRYLRPIVRGAL